VNISSIEVKEALYRHPAVSMAAVVAMPHHTWGETPCVFVELANGQTTDAEALKAWCRKHLAPEKVPGRFIFADIPRTSTGKVQELALRDRARGIAG
jgi:fatty-acyl-CoA synthase